MLQKAEETKKKTEATQKQIAQLTMQMDIMQQNMVGALFVKSRSHAHPHPFHAAMLACA
jgi:hypothetical protein